MVSHDTHFIENVCDEIWHVENNSAYKFKGDIHEFKKFVLAKKALRACCMAMFVFSSCVSSPRASSAPSFH